MHSTLDVVLLILAAVAFFLAVVIPLPHPVAAYRLNIAALGLLLWVVAVLLDAAKVVS